MNAGELKLSRIPDYNIKLFSNTNNEDTKKLYVAKSRNTKNISVITINISDNNF